jgi:REP element-mobilizing transposase RayT
MFSPIDQLTTIVSGAPQPFWKKTESPAPLYFHLVLRVNSEISDDEQETQLKKYIAGFIRKTGGSIKTINFAQNRVHLLVGLSQFCALGTFVRELKLVSATFAKRRLGAENFGWCEKYEAFTVSLSQIERVRDYISRQKWLDEQESYAASWNRIASCELY